MPTPWEARTITLEAPLGLAGDLLLTEDTDEAEAR
jgi:hypothetical protein